MNTRRPRSFVRRAAVAMTAGTLACAAAGGLPAPASAATSCPTHTTEIAHTGISTLWTDHGKLWSCTVEGGRLPQNRQLGPWTAKSQVILGDGAMVGWTQRTKIAGKAADLVWAADLSRYHGSPRFLSGLKPAIGAGSSKDLRVSALVAGGAGIAWVTQGGRVMSAFTGDVTMPASVGLGTPGAADLLGDGTPAGGGGLLAAPLVKGRRILIGRWLGVPAAQLADSLQLKFQGGGEADDCGASDEFDVLLEPGAGAQPVGAAFTIYRTSDGPACA